MSCKIYSIFVLDSFTTHQCCLVQLFVFEGTADLSFRMFFTPAGSRMTPKLNNARDLEQGDDHRTQKRASLSSCEAEAEI